MIEHRSIADELEAPDMHEALKYLRNVYADQCEQERRTHAALIDAQLTHKGAYAIVDYLNRALKDPANQLEHRELLRWCETNAIVSRVAEELATVYSEPARRTVNSGQENYDALCKRIQLDLVMRGANRLLAVHEAVWVSLRVRDDEPVLDVLSPARFSAVHPPSDPTHLIGVVTEIPRPAKPSSADPAYRFVGRWQTLVLNQKFELITSSENQLAPALPGVLISMTPVSVSQRLLPERASHDLTSAETAAAFQALIALRESLTVQKQAYLSGELSTTPMGQQASTQREVMLGEGVVVTSVDRSVDVGQYYRTADAIADTTAANFGLAPSSRKLTDASSGFEMWLRMQPLVKRRREQIDVLRAAEEQIAQHMSAVVNAVGLEQYVFDATGFAIAFGEVSMPQSESEELANFETRRRLLLDNTLSELARRGQLTDAQAAEELSNNAVVETERVALLQNLSAAGANSATTVGDNTNQNQQPKETIQ